MAKQKRSQLCNRCGKADPVHATYRDCSHNCKVTRWVFHFCEQCFVEGWRPVLLDVIWIKYPVFLDWEQGPAREITEPHMSVPD